MKLSHVLLLAAVVVAVAAPLLTEATGGGDPSQLRVKSREGMSGSKSGVGKGLKCGKDAGPHKKMRSDLKAKYKAGTLNEEEAAAYRRAKTCYRKLHPKKARDPSKPPKGPKFVPSEQFNAIKRLAIEGKLPANRIEEWKQAQAENRIAKCVHKGKNRQECEAREQRKSQAKSDSVAQCMSTGKSEADCIKDYKAGRKASKKEKKETKRLGAINVGSV
jgi:hypothetical protein